MQEGFFQKVLLCLIIGFFAAGMVEFYRNFINGADQALNGSHPHVRMHQQVAKK